MRNPWKNLYKKGKRAINSRQSQRTWVRAALRDEGDKRIPKRKERGYD